MAGEMSFAETIFTREELHGYLEQVQATGPHHIDILCGCSTTKFGDSVATLRISDDGSLYAMCHCHRECDQAFSSPHEFAKHGSRTSNVPNWRSKIWILRQDGQKVKISKTCLLKYYTGDQYRRPRNAFIHRDEFLRCSACNKVRRFELRTRKECREYHDAAAIHNITCSNMIPDGWTCDDPEERMSTRTRSGCRKKVRCKGCVYCVCLGCTLCRFDDCKCRTCVDFYATTC